MSQDTITVSSNGTAAVTLGQGRHPQLYVPNPDNPAVFGPVNQVRVRTAYDFNHGLAALITTWAIAAVVAVLLTVALRGYWNFPFTRDGLLPSWYAHGKGGSSTLSSGGGAPPSSGTGTTTTTSSCLGGKWWQMRSRPSRADSEQMADDIALAKLGALYTAGDSAATDPKLSVLQQEPVILPSAPASNAPGKLSRVLGASGKAARADSTAVQLSEALLPANYEESATAVLPERPLQQGSTAVPPAAGSTTAGVGSTTGAEQLLTPTAADGGNDLFPLQSPLFVASPTLPQEHSMASGRPPRPLSLHGQGSDRASQAAGLATSPPEGGGFTLPHSQSVMRASAQLQAAFSAELQGARRSTRQLVDSPSMQASFHQQVPALAQQSSHPQPLTQSLQTAGAAAAASARYLHMAQSLRASMGAGSPGGPGYFSEASPAGHGVTGAPGHTYGHGSHSSRRPPALDLPPSLTSGGTSGAGLEEHHRAL
jgi:hypothetical protein